MAFVPVGMSLSPEVKQRMKDRLEVPEIREALTFWVMQCVEKLGQVKSKRHIIGFLLSRLAPYGCSVEEAEFVYETAVRTYEKQRKLAMSIATNGHTRIIQN